MKVRKGFTLIELLVVIAIIAILAAILFPVFAQAREKARQTACLSNSKQMGNALMMYVQDYDETYPMSRYGGTNSPPWSIVILPYLKNTGVFACPSDPTAIVQTRQAQPWCPNEAVTVVNGQRRDLYRRSFAGVSGEQEQGTTPQQQYPGAIMVDGFGTTLASVDKPAGTILLTERYGGDGTNQSLTVCQAWGATWRGNADFILVESVQGGPRVNIITTGAFLQRLTPTSDPSGNLAGKYHMSGFNTVFGDGHAKWHRLLQTYKLTNGKAEWTMWDRRLAP